LLLLQPLESGLQPWHDLSIWIAKRKIPIGETSPPLTDQNLHPPYSTYEVEKGRIIL